MSNIITADGPYLGEDHFGYFEIMLTQLRENYPTHVLSVVLAPFLLNHEVGSEEAGQQMSQLIQFYSNRFDCGVDDVTRHLIPIIRQACEDVETIKRLVDELNQMNPGHSLLASLLPFINENENDGKQNEEKRLLSFAVMQEGLVERYLWNSSNLDPEEGQTKISAGLIDDLEKAVNACEAKERLAVPASFA
jgi:hypothetical protein